MLDEYQIFDHVGTTAGSDLYRAKRLSDNTPVLLKCCTAEHVHRFRQEYLTLQTLQLASVPRPIALFRADDGLAMVLDHAHGLSFASILEQQCLDVPTCLRLACQLARIVAGLHAARLTHHDLRPVNFLCDLQQTDLFLLDVSQATPDSLYASSATAFADWTYLSPEQTGRMNRAVDYRTDFYSLGIMLYQMLTGQLPFLGTDPLAYMHSHLARTPVPPSSLISNVPPVLSDIVMRLLAKQPDERYQSAHGLLTDLECCLKSLDVYGNIAPFALGAQDVPCRFHITDKLYGRDNELQLLLDAFERTATTGQATLVAICGHAGIGKSALAQGLRWPVMQQGGYFVGGKFDQYQRDIPYATLTQALRELVQQLLTESESGVAKWRSKILQAIAPYGQLIVDVLPQVELIIGKQELLPNLPPAEAQHRFQQVFRRFICTFACAERPLTLLLDDMQWIDAASLHLIEQILCHPDTRHLLLIGAYRDNETNPAHPLIISLERLRLHGACIRDVLLAPLQAATLNQLTASILHTPVDDCMPLTQLIYTRTEGNPFFYTQFLDTLYHDGLLWHDPQDRLWKWDLERIKAKNFADNAVDLVVHKLHLLPLQAQEILQLAACLGNAFDLERIALISQFPLVQIEQWLAIALETNLITRIGNCYKFLHDRIQQAAYSLIPGIERAAKHLLIGRTLLANLSDDDVEAPLYDTVSQLNLGAACIVVWHEKVTVANLNLRAGRKAMASAAYATAAEQCAAGLTLLGEEGWRHQRTLAFDLTLERARCEFAISRFEEAEWLINILLKHAISPIEQSAAYCLKLDLNLVRSEYAQAVKNARTCLRSFNIDLPRRPSRKQVQEAYEETWRRPEGFFAVENLRDLPAMRDPHVKAAMQILAALITPAYYVDTCLHALTLCHMLKLSLKHGNSEHSAYAYAFCGAILGPFFQHYSEGYRFAKLSCELVEQNDLNTVKAKVYLMMHMTTVWTQPISTSIEFARAALNVSIETGELVKACVSHVQLINVYLLRGDPLDDVWRESESALTFVRNARYHALVDALISLQRYIANMQGRTNHFSTFDGTQFNEVAFEAQLTDKRTAITVCRYWINKLQARFLSGDYAVAIVASKEAKQRMQSTMILSIAIDYFYYTALTVAALYDTGNVTQQRAWRTLLKKHVKQLREWADNNPATFRDKHLLVSAEIARIDGDEPAAIRLYQQAVDAASSNGFPHYEGIAHEAAARFYFARNLITSGRAHLLAARHCFLRWGAHGKVRQLEAHPQWSVQASRAPLQENPIQLDILSVAKASQAISGLIVLDELIETLMRIVLENAGAQVGYLLLERDGEWRLAADARVAQNAIEVRLHLKPPACSLVWPISVINYVHRTGEQVLLPDAMQSNLFSADPYFHEYHPRSVWCLPIRRQSTSFGLLYLEHGLVTHAFTPAQQAVLELLAAQAAISLENAILYADLMQENNERKQAEAALRAAHDELEERVQMRTEELARSNAELEQFAYVASHDLQEPLRMVTGYLQLLTQRYHDRLDTDANEFIGFAADGARRMQILIKDLLTYSRLGSQAKPLQPVDCAAVVTVVLRSLGAAIAESGARIEIASLPWVLGDEIQLTQLFQNLLANAIKFRGDRAPRIWIRAELESNTWHFAVQDNGIGIAPEHFERIFVMFQRLHSRKEYPGTGIGLALCKKIVERHGGRIWVESSAAGTTFHFILPIYDGSSTLSSL